MKARWAISLTHTFTRAADGKEIESTSYFVKNHVLNVWTTDSGDAKTWPRKADAMGYARRVLGIRPGMSFVNLAAHIDGSGS